MLVSIETAGHGVVITVGGGFSVRGPNPLGRGGGAHFINVNTKRHAFGSQLRVSHLRSAGFVPVTRVTTGSVSKTFSGQQDRTWRVVGPTQGCERTRGPETIDSCVGGILRDSNSFIRRGNSVPRYLREVLLSSKTETSQSRESEKL